MNAKTQLICYAVAFVLGGVYCGAKAYQTHKEVEKRKEELYNKWKYDLAVVEEPDNIVDVLVN